jgi:hypothetical protein
MSMEKNIYILSQTNEKKYVLSVDEDIILFEIKSKDGVNQYFINKEPYSPKNEYHEMIMNNWPFGFD